jgi:hypothetical protein
MLHIIKIVRFDSVFLFTLIFTGSVFIYFVLKNIFSQSLDFNIVDIVVSILLATALCILVFMADIKYTPILKTRRLVKTYPYLLEKQKIVFSNKSLKTVCKNTSSEYDYSWFENIYEDVECYYLVSFQKSAILIPKDAISAEQVEFLKSVVTKK